MSQGPCKTHYEDKSSPRYRADAGTYSFRRCHLKLQGSGTSPNIALTLCYHSTKIILSPCAQGILLASAVYGCSTILKCKSTKIFSYLYIIRCIFKTILTEKRFLSCHGRTRTGTGTSPNPSEGGECLPGLCHGRTRTFFFRK